MSLVTQDSLSSVAQLSTNLNARAFGYREESEEILRHWIGDGKYEEIEANTAHEFYDLVKRAETLMCVAIALPDMNRRLTEAGGHVTSIGTDQMGNANMLMSKGQVDAYCVNLRARARRLVRKLILPEVINRRSYWNT
jgi:hypothetical protein